MDFNDNPAEAAFRAEARSWVAANAPRHLGVSLTVAAAAGVDPEGIDLVGEGRKWQARKAADGWACLAWPTEYGGRDAPAIEHVIWQQEEGIYSALNRPFFIGQNMCAATLLAYADEDKKRRFLPPLASGAEIWCQLFSEPGAGSDLAGLQTRAVRHGEEWIINGQKIWTSGAHYSDFGILLARTDPDTPKHRGLTMFFVDMHSPGIEVRPIKTANRKSSFNEVYLTDVRIPPDQLLGPVNGGWGVSLTTLMNERLAIGGVISTGFPQLLEFCRTTLSGDGRRLIDDAAVRTRLATWACRDAGLKYTALRGVSALSRGEQPGPENSIGKLVAASMLQEIATYAIDLQGQAGALVAGDGDDIGAQFQSMLLRAPGSRIAGGTDEILRNIIAERVLGLPPEIRVDRDVPFNRIPGPRN